MVECLEVSRSGYYNWLNRSKSQRDVDDEYFKSRIRHYFDKSEQTYGVERIYRDLKAEGLKIGKSRVSRLMKEMGLVAVARKKFKVTTDSNHNKEVAPNLLAQDFSADYPDQVWVGDISYIWTQEGWLYLAVVLDLFSRKIVGWGLSDRLKRGLVIDAFKMAVVNRKPPAGLIFHSDKGSQYCSNEFKRAVGKAGAVQSMSGTGNCYDNAACESFFHTIKVERLHRFLFMTRAAAERCVFQYIEVFYNRKRRHSYTGYISPDAFERNYYISNLGKCG